MFKKVSKPKVTMRLFWESKDLRYDKEDKKRYSKIRRVVNKMDNEVFQKHILFRLFQLPQKFFPLGLTVGEVGHLRIVIHRMAAIAVDIVDQRCRTRIFLMQTVKGRRLLSQRILRHSDQLFDAEFQCPVSHLALGKPEQHGTKHMKQHDENKPGDFRGGIDLRVEKIDNHDHHKYGSTTVEQRQKPPKRLKHGD